MSFRTPCLWLCLGAVLFGQELELRGLPEAPLRLGRRLQLELLATDCAARPTPGPLPVVEGLELSLRTEVADPAKPRSHRWTLSVVPLWAGRFAIPELNVDTGEKPIHSAPVEFEVARDRAAEAIASLEMEVDSFEPYLHQEVELRFRLRLPVGFVKERMLQLFSRRLELPVQLEVPWLSGLKGLRVETSPPEKGPRFALGETVLPALDLGVITRGSVKTHDFVIPLKIRPETTGELLLPPALLRFAHATRFRDDFIEGRVPLDRQVGHLAADSLTLDVRPPPIEGRPKSFRDAIGQFRIRLATDATRVRVGESFRVELRIEGRGNLASLTPPDLSRLEGFHLLGRLDRHEEEARVLRYDFAALDATLTAFPAVPFAFFDPQGEGRYFLARTEARPLEVTPREDGEAQARPASVKARTSIALPGFETTPSRNRGLPTFLSLLLLLLPWALAAWILERRRRAAHHLRHPGARAARRAAHEFRRARTEKTQDLADAYAAYLAARLEIPLPRVRHGELKRHLEERGVAEDLADEADKLLDVATRARFGRGDEHAAAERLERSVSALERCFRRGARWLLLLVLCAPLARGQEPSQLFEAGRYEACARILEQEIAARPDDARRLIENLGACRFRQGRYAEALLAWMRLREQLPLDTRLEAKIALARKRLGLPSPSLLDRARHSLRAGDLRALLALVLVQGLLLTLALVRFPKRKGSQTTRTASRSLRIARISAAVLALALSLGALWVVFAPSTSGQAAVVLSEELPVRALPHEDEPIQRQLPAGHLVRVLEHDERWARVEGEAGREAWVPFDALGLIPAP